MRILNVTSVYYPELQFGGPPQKIHSLSRHLIDKSHQVRVLTFHSVNRKYQHSISHDGIQIRYVPWFGHSVWQLPLHITIVKKFVEWADIVHIYGLYNLLGPLAAHYCKHAGIPYILEPQGMYTPRGRNMRFKGVYHLCFTRWMVNDAKNVLAQSTAEAKELNVIAPKDRLVLRNNGIDLSLFAHLPSRDSFRVCHHIKDEVRIILFVGRISPIKNLDTLIRAFAKAAIRDSLLVLVGPTLEHDYAESLQLLVKKLHVEHQVRFIGPLFGTEKLAALSSADLFVLPSHFESYGNAAAEAVAAGIPVLLSDTCGIAPIIHGRAGLAVPPNIEGIADGLTMFLEEESWRTQCFARRDEVLAQLSWDKPMAQMESLYANT